MNQLETDLRAAFQERAARIHASSDLLATDYHPRTRRIRPPLAIGGVLAIAAAAAVVAALSLAGGASNAFAGWTAQPTAPTPKQLAASGAFCAKNVPFPGLPLKLSDTRGPFTFLVYSDGTSNDFCTTGPSFENASGWKISSPVTVPAGRLYLWAEHTQTDSGQVHTSGSFLDAGPGNHVSATNKTERTGGPTTTGSDHAYTSVIAQAGDGVSAATLSLDDGTEVTATVDNGWAVAWWPGSHQLTSAQLTTPSGTQTQTFPVSPCGLHKCSGGPHGG